MLGVGVLFRPKAEKTDFFSHKLIKQWLYFLPTFRTCDFMIINLDLRLEFSYFHWQRNRSASCPWEMSCVCICVEKSHESHTTQDTMASVA